MTLKLRANANALNRVTQRNTDALENQRRDTRDTADHHAALASLEQAQAAIEPPQPQTPATPNPSRTQTWAAAMTDVAAECSRNLAKLPPAQRKAEVIRIGALSEAARHIASAAAPNKAALLTTTSLTTAKPAAAPSRPRVMAGLGPATHDFTANRP